MQPSAFQIPHSFGEAAARIGQFLVAIIIASQLRGFGAWCRKVYIAIREGSAAAKERTATANKTEAEADDLRAHTQMDIGKMMAEMSVNAGRNAILTDRLMEKSAGQASSIELLTARIKQLEAIEAKYNEMIAADAQKEA